MLYLSKAQHYRSQLAAIVFILLFAILHWAAQPLLGFAVAGWLEGLMLALAVLILIGSNLLYYWKGAGSEERDRDENLRTVVVSFVLLVVLILLTVLPRLW